MQLYLVLALACHALAAPVALDNISISPPVRGGGISLRPRQQRGPSPDGVRDRQFNILYPRPGSQNTQQSPFQDGASPNALSSSSTPSHIQASSLTTEQVSQQPAAFETSPPATTILGPGSTRSFVDAGPSLFATSASMLKGSQALLSSILAPSLSEGITQSTNTGPTQIPFQNATMSSPSSTSQQTLAAAAAPQPLRLSLVNKLNSNNVHAYVSALDASGKVVMLQPDGNFYYLPETGSPIPQAITANVAIRLPAQGQSLEIAIPGFVAGARVWFADGTLEFAVVASVNGPALVEPTAVNPDDASADTNWGFVELAYVEGYGLFANLSFVDFIGLPLGMQLQTLSTGIQRVPGMPRDAVQQVCDRLRQRRGKAARYWADLCVSDSNGNPTRVISPAVLLSQQPDAFPTFFGRYVDRVWEAYATRPLRIDTQNDVGVVECRTIGANLACTGSSRTYSQPTAEDIFGCNTGPFAISQNDNAVHRAVVPRLCAALNRGTLLLEGGNTQPSLPPSSYYTARPHNVYSAIVHKVEAEGRGYAFSYDDVAPSVGQDVAGIVAAPDPQLLTVFVGGT